MYVGAERNGGQDTEEPLRCGGAVCADLPREAEVALDLRLRGPLRHRHPEVRARERCMYVCMYGWMHGMRHKSLISTSCMYVCTYLW